MIEKPLISVIVPVYKTEKYLDKCLDSIVNQTYKNLEIVLVDDDSPDSCPQICDDWVKRDSRIKALHIQNNGVANARNQGLNVVNGDYIGFVDSDDWTDPNMYEMLFTNLIEHNADIAVCAYQINNEQDCDSNLRKISQFDALKRICTGDYKYGVIWNKLYKKSVIKDIKMPDLVCCEDLVFNYFVFKNADKVVEFDNKLYHYYQNEDSAVHKAFSIGAFDALKSKEIIAEDNKNGELKPYILWGLILSCYVLINNIIKTKMFYDKYPKLRKYIVNNFIDILKSNVFSVKDKIKTIIFVFFPLVYKIIIR